MSAIWAVYSIGMHSVKKQQTHTTWWSSVHFCTEPSHIFPVHHWVFQVRDLGRFYTQILSLIPTALLLLEFPLPHIQLLFQSYALISHTLTNGGCNSSLIFPVSVTGEGAEHPYTTKLQMHHSYYFQLRFLRISSLPVSDCLWELSSSFK